MKLYVWQGDGVLEDYNTGLVVVLASSKEEARKVLEGEDHLAAFALGGGHYSDGSPNDNRVIEPEEIELDTPRAFVCWGGG